ncbi:MAG TPA: Hsp20 family protein [Steroidobacteraceae bacterium]|nr:Hsp20 family protein [Steroidobacteraceae bacterium]
MSTNVAVKKVSDAKQRTEPVFASVDAMLESIRTRAYELFSQRGFIDGYALEDWLKAEHEVSWPAAELAEEDQAYKLTVELRGYRAGEIEVTVTPQEIIVSAASEKQSAAKPQEPAKGTVGWSEFRRSKVCRRIEVASTIDTNQVTASFQDGLLTVKAAKQGKAGKKTVPVAAATLNTSDNATRSPQRVPLSATVTKTGH